MLVTLNFTTREICLTSVCTFNFPHPPNQLLTIFNAFQIHLRQNSVWLASCRLLQVTGDCTGLWTKEIHRTMCIFFYWRYTRQDETVLFSLYLFQWVKKQPTNQSNKQNNKTNISDGYTKHATFPWSMIQSIPTYNWSISVNRWIYSWNSMLSTHTSSTANNVIIFVMNARRKFPYQLLKMIQNTSIS